MGYREPKTGKTKTVTIESLGYLDVLQKDFADSSSHFKEIVRKMNAEKAQENLPISIKINKNEKLIEGTNYSWTLWDCQCVINYLKVIQMTV